MDALAIIVTALAASVIGPAVMVWVQGATRRRERREDWDRQDEVASRLLARQDQQTRAQGEVARRVADADQRIRVSAADTATQLAEIHTLVNSNLTEALRGQLAATVGHVAALRRAAGDPPDPADYAALTELEAAVDRMTTDLQDRDAAADRVDPQP